MRPRRGEGAKIARGLEEAARTAECKKLDRLASVLANGVDPAIIQPGDDLPSFVRDVSQLSELDIKTLEIIISAVPAQLLSRATSTSKSTKYDPQEAFLSNVGLDKIGNDDFYSTAYRLVGFGLALEIPSHTGRRSANDLRFMPTKRGRKLIALLKKHT
jgi:hypothetical protein